MSPSLGWELHRRFMGQKKGQNKKEENRSLPYPERTQVQNEALLLLPFCILTLPKVWVEAQSKSTFLMNHLVFPK